MALKDLITPDSNKLMGGSEATWVDADTISAPEYDKNIRLKGINAPETYKAWQGMGASQEAGATMTTDQVRRLANDMGYTDIVTDKTLDATGSRYEGDLMNPKTGRLFSQELAKSGVVDIHHDYDPGGMLQQSKEYAAFTGEYEGSEWAKAQQMILDATNQEMQYAQQFKRAQDYSGQVGELERILEETTDPTARANISRQIDSLSTAAKADIEWTDRNQVTGEAINPWSDSWDVAMLGMGEALYGVANMGGETFGSEAMADWGEAGVRRAQSRIGDKAWAVRDWKDVEDFGSAVDFVANNAIMSLPYMAATIPGAFATPLLLAPAALYTGQVWNEMEGEKDASVAIAAGVAQATLDKLGLSFITKGLTPKGILGKAMTELQKQGMSKEVAKATVMNASRQQLASLAGNAMDVAKSQLAAKNVFKNFAAKAAMGSGGEAVTEGLQEATAYTGSVIGSDKAFDWNELQERMVAGAIAGGALGGAFSTAGAAADTGAWADVAFRTAPADAARRSQSQKYAQQEMELNGRVSSIEEEAAKARSSAAARGPNATSSFDERVDEHKAKQKSKSVGEKTVEAALSVPSLWRGSTRWIFTPELQSRSRAARVLADMFGANLQRVFSGSNFESTKFHKLATYKNFLPEPRQFYSKLAGGRRASRKVRTEVSNKIYAQMQNAIVDGKFNPDLVPDGPEKATIVALANQLNTLSDKMFEDQKIHNSELGYQHNYLMRYKALNKKAVKQNRIEFQQALVKNGFSEADAKALTDEILDNNEVSDIDDAFSVTKGGIVPGAHRERSLNMSEKEEFQQFMEQDLFANVSHAAKSAARYTTHREFVGKDSAVINELLDQMQADGIPPEEVNKVAAQLKDYLDAESGNYKRPTSEMGKQAMRLQKSFMMLTTMAGLPLATVSSFVEAALTMRGLTMDQITRKDGGLASLGKEFGGMMWSLSGDIADVALNREKELGKTTGQQTLQELGFYEWDVGAATVTGVSETNAWQQDAYQMFFKAFGLTDWTNYTRAIRASIAGDYLMDNLQITIDYPGTNAAQEAEEKLRILGVNVGDMQGLWTKAAQGQLSEADVASLDSNIREATYNFINDAVALPGAANRPLIYQDPRFALFTQFQGFIATFTANHIPKLWGEYVKRGSPAMKYNAFAVMMTMIMLGFASQHLKDLIKYGGKTPHLDDAEYLQRGIRSSGLLGTSERILDQFFPLYEQRSDDVGEWFFNETTGQSPALSNLKRLGKATGAALEGDIGKAGKNFAKSTPVIGPFNYITEGRFIDDWKFRGE